MDQKMDKETPKRGIELNRDYLFESTCRDTGDERSEQRRLIDRMCSTGGLKSMSQCM